MIVDGIDIKGLIYIPSPHLSDDTIRIEVQDDCGHFQTYVYCTLYWLERNIVGRVQRHTIAMVAWQRQSLSNELETHGFYSFIAAMIKAAGGGDNNGNP